jgi:hypothetical protein
MYQTLVTARFTWKDRPVQGLVRFTPCRLWVVRDGITWACLAPEVRLDPNGSFTAYVTPYEADPIGVCYQVETPAGAYHLRIPQSETGWALKELVSGHHVVERSPY